MESGSGNIPSGFCPLILTEAICAGRTCGGLGFALNLKFWGLLCQPTLSSQARTGSAQSPKAKEEKG